MKSWLIWKHPDAWKDWGQEEKGTTEDEMVEWHHWLNGCGFGWTPGVGDGQGGLVCCNPWGHKESDTTEWQLNWNRWILWYVNLHFNKAVSKKTKQNKTIFLWSSKSSTMWAHLSPLFFLLTLYQALWPPSCPIDSPNTLLAQATAMAHGWAVCALNKKLLAEGMRRTGL